MSGRRNPSRPSGRGQGPTAAEMGLGPHSIQWFDADPGPCRRCGGEVGAGPAGFTTEEPPGPLCDVCLLKHDKHLGMLIWIAHVVRELADKATGIEDPWAADQVMVTLMTFAKLYHLGAEWPRREAKALDFVKELQERMARIPWFDLMRILNTPPS